LLIVWRAEFTNRAELETVGEKNALRKASHSELLAAKYLVDLCSSASSRCDSCSSGRLRVGGLEHRVEEESQHDGDEERGDETARRASPDLKAAVAKTARAEHRIKPGSSETRRWRRNLQFVLEHGWSRGDGQRVVFGWRLARYET